MKSSLEREVFRLRQRRKRRLFWTRICLLLACAVAVGTFYALSQPARTEEAKLKCTLQEHEHSDSCYELVLSCTEEEGEEHQHSELCYTRELICAIPEHIHTGDCYELPEQNTLELALEADETEPTDESRAPDEAMKDAPVSDGEAADVPDEPAADSGNGAEEPLDPDGTNPELTAADPKYFENLYIGPDGEPVPTGTDIAQYIDTVTVERLVNGEYVAATVFENGDNVRVNITYDIPRGVVTPESKDVYYILPEGISLSEETSGDVIDRGRAVGIYTITTTGLIQITFKNIFANGNAISGTVSFSGTVFANEDGSDREIIFDGEGGMITVIVPDTQKYDLSVTKTGDFTGSSFRSASYHVVVSSEKGSGRNVTIFDQFSVATPEAITNAHYNSNSFRLWHVSADGTRTEVSPLPLTVSSSWLCFEIADLPPLEVGERYELDYNIDMDSDPERSGELHNEVEASTEKLSASASYIISYTSDISKQGVFNLSTGLIDWLITVNPDGRDVSGWSIHDDLPSASVGPVLITSANGSVFATVYPINGTALDFTFPEGSPAMTYYIHYTTAVTGSDETVYNEVTLINEDTVTVSSTVTVEERQESVDKQAGPRHVRTDGTVETYWNFTINLPPTELTSYFFRDVISSQVLDIDLGDFITGPQHYGIASEIDQALLGNLHLVSDGKNYYYGDIDSIVDFNVVYYNGSTEVPADDSSTHITRFAVTVTPRNGRSFHGYQIIASDYPTFLDTSTAVQGDYWSYQNYIYLQNGMYDMAPSFFRKGNVFEKQVLHNDAYTNDDVTVGFSECSGLLDYRLIVDLASVTTDAIEVVDHLPAGLSIVPGSESVNYFNSTMSIAYSGNFSQEGSFTSSSAANEDGSADITFNAYNITEDMKTRYVYICISYQAKLTDTSKWNDYTEAEETFSNTSNWNGNTSRQDTTVYNYPKKLEKSGEQVLDELGKPTGVVRYKVIINAGEEDLDPTSDKIVLSDHLSANVDVQLNLSSVSLYKYDRDSESHIGAFVPRFNYLLEIDPTTGDMNITIDDEQGYVLVYEYDVNSNEIVEGQSQVNNSILLASNSQSSSTLMLQGVESSATAWQSVVNVYKVDANNYSKLLSGAQFNLSYRDSSSGTWINVPNTDENSDVFTTNEEGLVVLTLTGSDQNLFQGRLYRLAEIKAPIGYEGSERDFYFIIKPDSTLSNEEVFDSIAADSGISISQIRFFAPTGGTLLALNNFKGVTVVKHWEDSYGAEITNPDSSEITLTLFRSTDPTGATGRELVTGDSIVNPAVVQPDADGNWEHTWPAMPESLPTGEKLYYFVEEAHVSGYEPIYPVAGVEPGSTLILTNHMRSFVLPKTGSSGSSPLLYIGLGLMLFSVAAAVLFKRKTLKKQNVKLR